MHVCIQPLYWRVNNKRRYLIFSDQFVAVTQLVFELCLRTDKSIWYMSSTLLSHTPASTPVKQAKKCYRVKWKSSLVSHFLLPADLWPCCTSVVPALVAAQHPPALPGAAAEHPNEKEGQIKETSRVDLNTETLHPPAPSARAHLYSLLSLQRNEKKTSMWVW